MTAPNRYRKGNCHVRVIQVVEVEEMVGDGINDPIRWVHCYFDMDGALIAETDGVADSGIGNLPDYRANPTTWVHR